uniref:putative N-acetylated-alpha-linked acidic dipeptidase n=1 Tax=Styela clava TaxID=7725 RepID=UPI00193944F7|nr:putative N-acetylated-alpha-linked acidic dipeptidase [Styela clava]
MQPSHRIAIVAVSCAAFGIIIGVLIGWYSHPTSSAPTEPNPPTSDPEISKQIRDEIKAENIELYLKELTDEPHIAGRDVDEKILVDYIRGKWEDFGFDVEVHPYDVLLSYPDQEDSNLISVILDNGTELYKSQPSEKILDDSQISDKVVNPFNAYSATGDTEGHLVYVNYARIDDFLQLTRDLGVNPAGHVCISRYGRIFRGSKAQIAQSYGCKGLILYSDPYDYTVPWSGVYPDDWFLPGTGAQRGNLQTLKGDPLTPQYPAIDTAWRMYENETTLPTILVTPIGYDDAVKYLERMGGDEVPEEWKGSLNITYRLGPGFVGELNNTGKIKMHITTKNERAITHNIFGYIRGEVEPDRYVLIGNHRDAWVFGAMDPSSGTAAQLEIGRSIGVAVKKGWRPRRTIVLCNWGAEEYGVIGSTEWVEEFQKLLSSRSVAYLNIDTAVQGNYTLRMGAGPHLNELIFNSAKFIETPHDSEIGDGRNTMYETWADRSPKDSADPNSLPLISTLGSGSDYMAFIQITGIPSVHIRYYYDTSIGIRSYPVYHSVYETFDLVKDIVDPDFRITKSVAQLTAEIAWRLIDNPVLPLNCVDYAARLWEDKDIFVQAYGQLMSDNGINLNEFDYALQNFSSAAEDMQTRVKNVNIANDIELRAINDQLMQLERAFIDMNGIGNRTNVRHVIYAPSLHDTYASSAFPGLVDSLFDIDSDSDPEKRWREVRRQYSILLFHIGSAASTLRDVVPVKGYSNY